MTRRIRIASIAAVVAIAVPAIVLAATNAYTSPTLKVSYAGTTTVTANQAPGSPIGSVKAQVSALALGGALLPLEGPIIVAPPGAIPAAAQSGCVQEATPTASWILQLSAAGQTINLPAYVLPTAGAETALGPAKIRFCLAPPDIPVEKGGATFGAKFLSAALTVNNVFSKVSQGAWIAFWTPWQAGNGQVNQAGTVASPAAVAAGAVTIKAKKAGLGAVVTGKVTQGGLARPAATVTIWGAKGKAALRRLGAPVKTSAAGTFSFRAKTGDVYQARVAAGSISAPPLCQLITPQLQGIPCINPTANGFTATSGLARKK